MPLMAEPWTRGVWMRMPEVPGCALTFPPRNRLMVPQTLAKSRSASGAHIFAGAVVFSAGATCGRMTARASASTEVDEETRLALEQELASWGGDDDAEDDLSENDDAGELEPTETFDESDWRHWVEKISKETVWKALRGGSSKEEWEQVVLALRRGDVLTSTDEYEDALGFLAKKSEGWRDAEVILQCMWFNGFFPDHRHYALVMKALGSKQRWTKIIRLFEEMAEHDIKPSEHCYNLAIEAYGRIYETEGALQLLKAMAGDGHTPTLSSYHGILYALAKEGAWLKSLEILEDMLENEIQPTRRTFNLLVLAYSNGGEFARVLETIDYMQKMGLEPSILTFLYGMRAAESAGQIDQGLELFRRMKAQGLKTNEAIDEALMRICLAANDPDRALQFFDAAVQRRQNWRRRKPEEPVQKELGIYRQALRACELAAASGMPPGVGVVSYEDYALQLLLELRNAELKVDGTMYLHAVTTCEYVKSWSRVIALLREMKEKGIKVEGERLRSAYWNGILSAEEDDNVDQAFELFEQMKEYKLTVEPFMYISMVRMLEQHGQLARAHSVDTEFLEKQMKQFSQELMIHRKRNEWQEAVGVLDKIREQNLTPTLKITNTAMSALQKPGKWEMVLDLMDQMAKDGHRLDACSHTVAMSAMISAGELEKAVEQLEVMQKQGVHPTSLTYGRLIFALEAAGQPQRALYLWDEMRSKRIEPDRVAYESAIRACKSCEFWDAVLELYGEMKEKDKGPSRTSRQAASMAAERLGLAESVMQGATPTRIEDARVLEASS